MTTPNGYTNYKNLKVVISENEMQQVRIYCKKNGLLLGAWAGKVLVESIQKNQEGQHA